MPYPFLSLSISLLRPIFSRLSFLSVLHLFFHPLSFLSLSLSLAHAPLVYYVYLLYEECIYLFPYLFLFFYFLYLFMFGYKGFLQFSLLSAVGH